MRLTYFNVRGRVEPARLMMELAGVEYTYEGVTPEVWRSPEGKARMIERTPFGQLPIFEDGAFMLCQSGAIHRYLARKLKLYGDTIEEMSRVDEVYETYSEFLNYVSGMHWNPKFHEVRAEQREETKKKLESIDRYFARTRADAEHWVLPGRYTLADASMAFVLETVMPQHPGLLEEFPALHHMMKTFFRAPGVRDYVRSDRRPRTWTVPMATFAGKPEETHHWTDTEA